MGVRIALDDFGTGYSSLSYLRYLPLDAVKIDRSFVADIDYDPKQAALVRAIVTLCHTLELQTVAEGIEHASQASRLVELNCDQGQGYYLAHPFDPATLDAGLAVQLFGGLPMLRAA
jgi:EAL domain-containing protein (putative c-di-GMP-specific phosphodiesterase class I)